MSKQAERDYAIRVPVKDLYTKPFADPRMIHEFAIVLDLFQKCAPHGKILDLGCGPGWTSLFLERAGYDVVGVDIADKMIEVARDRAERERSNAEFHVADMENLDLGNSDFDGVLLFDCLHHCTGYEHVLKRAFEHLKPGGSILLFETTLLHRFSPHAKETEQEFGVTELGFSRFQLSRALKRSGFESIQFHRDPGTSYLGFLGLLKVMLRVCCDFVFYYPRAKNIVVARKPSVASSTTVRRAA